MPYPGGLRGYGFEVPFPSPPWSMRGTLWLSLFAVGTGTPDRAPGLYGAAFADYTEGSAVTYHELVVARLVREGVTPRVRVTDIWVDSPVSRDAGRSLWALPKQLADLHMADRPVGPATRTSWDAGVSGTPLAAARFSVARVPALRTPFRFSLTQQRDDGGRVVTPVAGSSRNVPAAARWDFALDGPLAWLHGRVPIASFRVDGVRMTFGG